MRAASDRGYTVGTVLLPLFHLAGQRVVIINYSLIEMEARPESPQH